MKDCIFCKIAKGEIKVEKIYENNNFFSIKDIKPQVREHSLVISKNHFNTILDLPEHITPELLDCTKKTTLKLMEESNIKGFNLVNNSFEVAGQIVNHFHLHILPRREGDGIRILV